MFSIAHDTQDWSTEMDSVLQFLIACSRNLRRTNRFLPSSWSAFSWPRLEGSARSGEFCLHVYPDDSLYAFRSILHMVLSPMQYNSIPSQFNCLTHKVLDHAYDSIGGDTKARPMTSAQINFITSLLSICYYIGNTQCNTHIYVYFSRQSKDSEPMKVNLARIGLLDDGLSWLELAQGW
jgi:hypothetical protein